MNDTVIDSELLAELKRDAERWKALTWRLNTETPWAIKQEDFQKYVTEAVRKYRESQI